MKYLKTYEQLNSTRYSIKQIQESDIDEVLELANNVFNEQGINMDHKGYIGSVADWDISLKMVDDNSGEIIGFYVFNNDNIPVENDTYTDNGLHGVALGIDSKYKGLGLGKQLINYPMENMGDRFDYIWGMHLKGLNNIEDWKKRRDIISDNGSLFITATKLKK
jgi:GNAT superfamily N-acetyltransferase